MAKFCGKCGAQLDQYGRCPNCTAGKGDSTVRQTPGQKTNGRKKQKKRFGNGLLRALPCLLWLPARYMDWLQPELSAFPSRFQT